MLKNENLKIEINFIFNSFFPEFSTTEYPYRGVIWKRWKREKKRKKTKFLKKKEQIKDFYQIENQKKNHQKTHQTDLLSELLLDS